MNFEALENNIIDFIQEEQQKLGYHPEAVRVYYFLPSLSRYAGRDCSIEEMRDYLIAFREYARERLGELRITRTKERFCLTIPEKGTEYIHSIPPRDLFLPDLLKVVSHHCTYEEILAAFYRHSEHIHTEKISTEDFDLLVYFEDGVPNTYRYCFKLEGEHIIYHRFVKEDYEDLFG